MSNRAEKHQELIAGLKDVAAWLHEDAETEFAETVEWAAAELGELIREAAVPATILMDCLCKSKPVVLEHLEQDNFMIGCPQAFLRAEADAPACKKPVVMRAIGRAEAVASWNDLIRKYESESAGQL